MTVAGSSSGMKCIFPFIFEEVTHNACTEHGNAPEWEPWCSTKVSKFGVHIEGGGHWGDCGPECPFESGDLLQLYAIMEIFSALNNFKRYFALI